MKKIVLTMVALLSLTAMQAQNREKKFTPEDMTARMAKELNLTDAQKAQVTALNKEYQDVLKRPGMRRGPRPHKPDGQAGAQEQAPQKKFQKEGRPQRPELTEAQKAQMKQHMEKRKEYDGKLKKILTDEQYANWKKHHGQHRGHHGHHGHGGPHRGGHPQGPIPQSASQD